MIGANAAPSMEANRVGPRLLDTAPEPPAGDELFRRIGAFLAEHRLSSDPGHYAFAFHVLREGQGPLGEAVARAGEGGGRLTRDDVERLGGAVPDAMARAAGTAPAAPGADPIAAGAGLVARTRNQIEGFADVVRAIQDEARGFGRDLAASAEAIRRTGDPMGIDDIVELTRAMVERVRAAERRLESATGEVAALRAQLKEAQGSARRDALTGLPNRRAFEEAFAALAPDAGARLAICDVDWFKRVNDRFGHAVGDRVLTAIGRTLAGACAPHLVARYGGEEFVVLMTGVSGGDAAAIVDGARQAVAARTFRARETDQPFGTVTLSAGIGAIVPGEAAEEAVARVDEALYRAKADGRNRIATIGG